MRPPAPENASRGGDSDAEGLLSVPLQGRHGVLGALTLVSAVRSRQYTAAHLAIALDIGRRAGLAIENARLGEQEQAAADLLRDLLTPPPPEVPGYALSVPSYDPCSFYDVWPDGCGAYWIAVGLLAPASGEHVTSVAELAAAAQTQRALRTRAAATGEPAAVVAEVAGPLWVGRLAADGRLAHAGDGSISAQLLRSCADAEMLAQHGVAVLAPDDALVLRRSGNVTQPENARSGAGPEPVLFVRRRPSPAA